ncbi:MAG: alpha/beta fold hydrolase [Nodosilinea sp.]
MSQPMPCPRRLFYIALASVVGLTGLGLGATLLRPEVARSADKFTVRATGPFVFSLSVDALETFAETGEITGDLRTFARFLDAETLASLRQLLQVKLPLDVVTTSHLAYSPLGRDALTNVGKIFESSPGVNGFHGLRAAVINAAAQAGPEGWTLIDVMREFPTQSIDVSLGGILDLRRALSVYLSYNRAVVAAIRDQAATEAATQTSIDPAALPDLSQPGPHSFTRNTITVTNPALRQTGTGLTVNYDFDVDVYLPQGVSGPVPVVIVSHGFGAVKEDFVFLNEHLASYGYAVLAPDHVGSDLSYRANFLGGRLNTLLSPIEFINRPREISFLIDELERLAATSPDWAAQLNLDQIAVIGDSLGSTTAMALAGAEITFSRITAACDSDLLMLNFAQYLECRARYLPPKNYDLSDSRVKAVIAAHLLGSALYGPEGISQVQIPVLMVSGDRDTTSPVVTEQIFPFVWQQQQPRYLALLQAGTHFSSKPPGEGIDDVPSLFVGENRDVGATYYTALATAFLGAHLRGEDQYLPYLTARNAQAISAGQPMIVDMISSLTAEQIAAAYDGDPPVAVIPPPIAPVVTPREESILATIQRTGELRIAMRRDAPPFGYVDDQDQWTGYCSALGVALRDYLQDHLDPALAIELVEIPSTLDDRFNLVRDGNVDLECGPNTVREGVEGITFSDIIFATGSHFLTTAANAPNVNPALSLAGLNIGVLANSTNAAFLAEQYPAATITPFSGPTGRVDGIQAVNEGDIDAFLGDDILTISEVLQQSLSVQNLTLVPEIPLTCEFYGLALPNDDPEWVATVNGFLEAKNGADLWAERLGKFGPYVLNTLSYCLNR